MNEQNQNEQQQQNEPRQKNEPRRNEEKRGEVLRKMVSLASDVARGLVSRTRWMVYTQRGRRMMAGLAVTGAVAGVVAAQPLCMIEPGEVGIRVNRLTGNVSELREGWALLLPQVHRLSRYSLKDQTYQPTRSTRATDPAPFQSVEGLSIGVEITIRYLLDPA
ncbi:MAG TPA: SPFH domain-containing protein, partial [Archangium sp.]|uniref:SPFH domain-containing protein n=1 Tax=Archangium sp. TaxID=1872627 RepID=UPI002EDB43BC